DPAFMQRARQIFVRISGDVYRERHEQPFGTSDLDRRGLGGDDVPGDAAGLYLGTNLGELPAPLLLNDTDAGLGCVPAPYPVLVGLVPVAAPADDRDAVGGMRR